MFIMGKERDYIVHDEKNVKGFFGEYRFLSKYLWKNFNLISHK